MADDTTASQDGVSATAGEDEIDDDAKRRIAAAGVTGAAVGGLGSAAMTGEATTAAAPLLGPAGVSLGSGGVVGPAGVSLGSGSAVGPAGVSLGSGGVVGPAGVSLGSGGVVGPAGVSMGSGAPATGGPRGRLGLIIGAAAVVVVVAVGTVIAVSSGDDRMAPAAVAPVVSEAAPTEAAETTSTAAAPATTAVSAAASCTVGSWVADNKSLINAIIGASDALGGFPLENGDVTGTARLDITADGHVVTTFDNWLLTSPLPQGIGTATVSVTGVETHDITFADDDSYTINAATQAGTHLAITIVGDSVFDSALPSGVLIESGTYTCAGDQLVIVESTILSTETFTRTASNPG